MNDTQIGPDGRRHPIGQIPAPVVYSRLGLIKGQPQEGQALIFGEGAQPAWADLSQLAGAKAFLETPLPLTAGDLVDVAFDTVMDEYGDFFDAGSGKLVIPAGFGGTYLVIAQSRFAVNGTGERIMLLATEDFQAGGTVAEIGRDEDTGSASVDRYLRVITTRVFNPGDTCYLRVLSTGASVDLKGGFGSTFIALSLLGAAG